jgi:hypothetical protein
MQEMLKLQGLYSIGLCGAIKTKQLSGKMAPIPLDLNERKDMMTYRDYVSGVCFRYLKPLTMLPGIYDWSDRLLRSVGIHLDVVNTRLPDNDQIMKDRLREICRMPRMSTFAIGAMINYGVSQMPDNLSFVNVGVWHGFSLLSGMIGNAEKRCVGIDNFAWFGKPRKAFFKRFNKYKSPNHYFYEMDYLEYFTKVHEGPIGFYVYDGPHGYDAQLGGLLAAEPFFSETCIVLIDDTNWDDPRRAALDFISQSSHEYQIILDRRTSRNGHPTFWNGIMILQRTKERSEE